jgi:hypothetical protein
VECAKAEVYRADKFPNVIRRTRPGLEPRETRGTRETMDQLEAPSLRLAVTAIHAHSFQNQE